MRTSRLYDQRCDLLGQSSHWVDRRHLQTLVWMVIGVICSECISLTKWGVYVQSRATFAQSHQRRFSRWLHNSRIHVYRVYSPLIKAALAQWGVSEITLIEDTTMLWDESCLIRLSIQYRGRAIPLTWRVWRHGSSSVRFKVTDELASVQTFRESGERFQLEEALLNESIVTSMPGNDANHSTLEYPRTAGGCNGQTALG